MFQSAQQHIDSYYAHSQAWPTFPNLQDALECDVLIVGAGFSGLHTALKLAENGHTDVTIIEASRIAWAASGRNGGQAILGWSCDMEPLEDDLGYGDALALWQDMEWAAQEIRDLPARHHFDIDYQAGHLWCAVKPSRIDDLKKWQENAANKWHYESLQWISKQDLPKYIASNRYQAGLFDPNGGHLHPMKLCYGIADTLQKHSINIFEQTPALNYQRQKNGYLVNTPQGQIRCQRLVLACNAYIDGLDATINRRILPVGCLQVTTEVLDEALWQSLLPTNACVTDNQLILDYFRLSADKRLLFGGGCTYMGVFPKDIAAFMQPMMTRVFPQLKGVKIDYAWGGHLDCTVRRTPDIGTNHGMYWLQGFSGHGILPTLAAARAVAEAILGNSTRIKRYQELHNPNFIGNDRFAAPLEALGKMYYRLRDVI